MWFGILVVGCLSTNPNPSESGTDTGATLVDAGKETGDPSGDTSGPTDRFDAFAEADLTDLETVRFWANARGDVVHLQSHFLPRFSEANAAYGCPKLVEDPKTGRREFTGGCKTASGILMEGTLVITVDDPDNPTVETVAYTDYGFELDTPCLRGSTTSTGTTTPKPEIITATYSFNGSVQDNLVTGAYEIDLWVDLTTLIPSELSKKCETTAFVVGLEYTGTVAGPGNAKKPGPNYFSGSGRVATNFMGNAEKIEVVNTNELVDLSGAFSVPIEGSTTLRSQNDEAVITYVCKGDCKQFPEITWTLNGQDRGELDALSLGCSALPSTSPLWVLMAPLLLLLVRTRRSV